MDDSSSPHARPLHGGALMTLRDGRAVAAHFGSPAGEIAICARGVGVALRSDLAVYRFSGASSLLDDMIRDLTGVTVVPHGCTEACGSWWCRESATRLLLVGTPDDTQRVVKHVQRFRGRVIDVHETALAVIELAGRRTSSLLQTLGAYGPAGAARATPPFSPALISETPVWWLLESAESAYLLVDALATPCAWRAITDAGSAFGAGRVGRDAVERYRVGASVSSRAAPTLRC